MSGPAGMELPADLVEIMLFSPEELREKKLLRELAEFHGPRLQLRLAEATARYIHKRMVDAYAAKFQAQKAASLEDQVADANDPAKLLVVTKEHHAKLTAGARS